MNKSHEQYFNKLDHQDWNQVILKSKQRKNENENKTTKLSQSQLKDIKLHKLVDEDNLKHKKITSELKTTIIQARTSKKWKQKDLALKCNLPLSVINEIESGKAIYNHQHINKIKRILNI